MTKTWVNNLDLARNKNDLDEKGTKRIKTIKNSDKIFLDPSRLKFKKKILANGRDY